MVKAKTKNQSANRPPDFTGNIRDERGRFKPGFSGNPAGKPLGSLSLTARIKAELKKMPPGQRMRWEDVLIRRIVKEAIIDGNPRMIELLWKMADPEAR